MQDISPYFLPAKSCLASVVKHDENLVTGRQVGSLHHQNIFKLPDCWNIKLQKLTDSCSNLLAIILPPDSKGFRKKPPDALEHQFGIHVIGFVRGRNVNSTTSAAEFVDRARDFCHM